MFVPGKLIALITFPGVMVHEWAHKKMCEMVGVEVKEVVYFQFKNPVGYVIHEQPKTFKQVFWISVGPLLINSLLAFAIGFFVAFLAFVMDSFAVFRTVDDGLVVFLLIVTIWIGVSIGVHSFPSDQDAKFIIEKSKEELKNGGSSWYYFSYPFFWLIWLSNKLSIVWFDYIYGIGLTFLGYTFSGILFL